MSGHTIDLTYFSIVRNWEWLAKSEWSGGKVADSFSSY